MGSGAGSLSDDNVPGEAVGKARSRWLAPFSAKTKPTAGSADTSTSSQGALAQSSEAFAQRGRAVGHRRGASR